MGRASYRYTSTDYWFACPCGFRYNQCGTNAQLNMIAKLHFKKCDQGSELTCKYVNGEHIISEGKSQAQHVDAAIQKENSS